MINQNKQSKQMSKHIKVNIEYDDDCGVQIIKGIDKTTMEQVTIQVGNCDDGGGMFECTITYDNRDEDPIYQSHCCSKEEVESNLNAFYINVEDVQG